MLVAKPPKITDYLGKNRAYGNFGCNWQLGLHAF